MQDNESRKWLYQTLQKEGYNVGKDYEEFENLMITNEDSRRWCYDRVSELGYNVGKDYDEFNSLVGPSKIITREANLAAGVDEASNKAQQQAQRQAQRKTRYDVAQEQYEQGRQQTNATPISQTAMGSVGGYGISPMGMPVRNTQGYPQANPQPQAPAKPMAPAPRAGQWSGAPTTRVPFAPTEEEGNTQYMPLDQGEDTKARYDAQRNAVGGQGGQVETMRSDIDSRLQEAYQRDLDNYGSELDKGGFWARMGRSVQAAEGNNPAANAVPSQLSDDTRDYQAAKHALDNSQKIIDEANAASRNGNFFAGAGRGMRDKFFDVSTWDFGITDVTDQAAILRALEAYDKGEQLTESQQALLDAKAVELATTAYFGSELGRGYKAGQVTAEAIPFMFEMAINPAAGIGKGASKAMVRYALKRFGKEAIEKGGKRYVAKQAMKYGTRIVGDVAGAGTMAATTGAARTAADAMQRMAGNLHYGTDEHGNITFDGHTDAESVMKAFGKAFASTTIENYSEMLGNYFGPALGLLGKGASKVGKGIARTKAGAAVGRGMDKIGGAIENAYNSTISKKIGLQAVGDFIGKVPAGKVAGFLSELEKRAQWHGVMGEYTEEIAGGLLNALVVGDQTLDKDPDTGLFNWDNNVDTFLGVALMGGFFAGAKTVGYGVERAHNARQYNKANRMGAAAFGDGWADVQAAIESDPKAGAVAVLADPNSTKEQREAALRYAVAVTARQGMEQGKAKRDAEGVQTQQEAAAEQSYNTGYEDANTDELRSDINMAYTDARQKLVELIGEDAVNEIDSDPLAMQAQYDQDMTVDDNTKYAIASYVSAKSAWDGVQQRIADDAEDRAEAVREAYKPMTREDGSIHPVTLNVEGADGQPKTVYLLDGSDVVLNPDGSIDREKSSPTLMAYDPEQGKNIFIYDPYGDRGIQSVGEVTTPEALDQLAGGGVDGQDALNTGGNNGQGARIPMDGQDARNPQDGQGARAPERTPGAPEAYTPGMVMGVVDNAGQEHVAEIVGRVRYDKGKFVPDENGMFVEYTVDGQTRHEAADKLNGKVRWHETAAQPQQPITAAEGQQPTAGQTAPQEGVNDASDTRTPAQRTYDDIVAKLGADRASHKIDATAKVKADRLAKAEKALKTAQETADNTEYGSKEEQKAEAAVVKAQAEYETAQQDMAAWDEVRKLRDQALIAQSVAEDAARKAERDRRLAEESEAQRKQREAYAAEQARRKAEAEAAEKRRQEENERLRQQAAEAAANPQPAEPKAPIEGTKGQASQLEIARQELADDPGALAMLEDIEPRTLEEVAAHLLSSGKNQVKLQKDDFMRNTGYGPEDVKKYPFIFAGKEKGGITIARLGEMIESEARDSNIPFDENDAMAGVTAALNMLGSVGSQGDINGYITNSRIAEAYDYHNAALAAARANMLEAYGMTEGEYESYMSWLEDAIEQGKSTLSDEEFNQIFNVYGQGQTTDVARGNQEGAATTERTESAETDTDTNGERGNGETDAGTGEQAAVSNSVQPPAGNRTDRVDRADREGAAIDLTKVESLSRAPRSLRGAIMDYALRAFNNAEAKVPAFQLGVPEEQQERMTYEKFRDEFGELAGANFLKGADEYLRDVYDYIDSQLVKKATAQAIAAAEAETDTNPTEGQKEAGNYKKGHVRIDGYDITIEQPKGSVRRGTDKNGRAWEQEMHNTYGYIRGTESVDGDHIDIFLSDDPTQGNVYVVDQVNEDGTFDEHKVMYGFPDMESARQAYLSNYEDGWRGLGTITPVSKEEFKKWIESSHRKTKPFSEYKRVKTEGDVMVGEGITPAAEQPRAAVGEGENKEPKESGKNITDVEAGGAVVDKLEKMGVEVSADIAENRRVRKQAENDKSENGKIHELRTTDGKVYGFAYRGKLYLDPRKIDAELPLHEYAHLWTEAMRMLNPKKWAEVVERIKQDKDAWQFIKSTYPDLKTDSEIADEVIATFSGKNGAEKLKAALDRFTQNNPDYKSRWNAIFNSIAKALQDFWKAVSDFLNIKYESAEQVYDQVLKDFVSGMNPRARVEKYLQERETAYMQAAEKGDVAKATEIFNQALSEEIGNGMTPFIAVGRYVRASRIPTLAHKVKSRDPKAIDEVAELIAPIIPKNAVLVPAPSHNGRATDMLDLAKAIAKRTGSEVADVLTSEPRDSQYETKKRGGLIASQDMGITMTGTLPEVKIPVVIDNVVGSGNTAEACVRAIGKGLVVSLGDAADRYNHAVSLKSAAPILRDRNNNIVPLSKRFELGGSQYLGRSAYERADGKAAKVSARERKLRDAIVDLLRKAGIDVVTESEGGQRVLDMANGRGVTLNKAQKRILETAPLIQEEGSRADISSIDGAKVLKNLDILAEKLENSSSDRKNFLQEVGNALNAKQHGSKSQYATFETKNGQIVTIRLGNHNATVSRFDNNGEDNGISIVISRRANQGITNDGNAHLVEYFYSDKAINRAEGKPLAEIVRSIKQALYSGEYKDTTGLAEREEVNAEQVRLHRVYHGSGADFERFDHSHMGEGEGAQSFGWGTYVTEVEGIGRHYAENLPKVWFSDAESGYEVDWEEVRDNWEEGEKRSALLRVFENARGADFNMEKAIENAISEIEGRDGYEEELAFLRQLTSDNFKIDRNLYTVEIHEDNGSNYLEWDKKASDKQTEAIKNALMQNEAFRTNLKNEYDSRNEWTDKPPFEEWLENVASVTSMYGKENGKRLYNELSNMMGSEQAVSEFLHSAGIVGIKYPADYYNGGRSDGAKNYVIFDESDLRITDKVKFFRTESGEAYGFTMGDKIYLDPRIATAETPIHEYTHLWAAAMRAANPKAWEQLKSELEKDTELMAYVRRLYPELAESNGANGSNGLSDELAEEVFAHFSGRRGAERLREEQRKAMDEASDYVEKAGVVAMFERLRDALRRFWNMARDLFAGKTRGIKSRSAEDFADMVLGDLVGGFKPDRGDRVYRSDRERDAEYMEAVNSGDMETAQRLVDEAAKRAMPDTKVVDENGNPKVMYHVTDNGFTVFHSGNFAGTIYFAFTNKGAKRAARGKKKTVEAFINAKKTVNTKDNPIPWYEAEDNIKVAKWREEGYDGVYVSDEAGVSIAVFSPEQIKSADPVTYDDNGNVIPLSERFTDTESDVRFRGEEEPVFYSNAMRAVENIKQERATPEQWVKMIEKQGGMKAGEDKWLGLSEWLKGSDAKTLTKGEVLDYIRANEIQVEEVEYADAANNIAFEALKQNYDTMLRDSGYDYAWEQMREQFGDDAEIAFTDVGGELEIANAEAAAALLGSETPINEIRLSYTTEGLDNKREIVLTVPTIEPWNEHDEIHFGEAGGGRAVAWVRFGETTDADGKRVLVIDEIQSNRHEEGRDKGYRKEITYEDYEKAQEEWDGFKTDIEEKYHGYIHDIMNSGQVTEEEKAQYDRYQAIFNYIEKGVDSGVGVPDAPFDKNWHEVAMKRMLRFAAENGYDKVAWTKGEQQAERYNIGNVVESIEKIDENTYRINTKDGSPYQELEFDDDGVYRDEDDATLNNKSMADIFGKELAEKLQIMPAGDTLKEDDLRIGGEGMKGFYDQILPRFMDKYGKKWGVKTGEVDLPNIGDNGLTMWSVDVTDDMRESVMRGQPLFRPKTQSREGGEEAAQGDWYERGSVERIGAFAGYTPKQIAKMNARQEESARRQFREAAEKLHLGDRITFVDTIDEEEGIDEKQRKAWRRKKGWYSPRTGKIVIILGNHRSMDDVMKSILHEGVAHHGLRQMFGKHFDTFLDNVYLNASPEIRGRINEMAKKHGWDFREATEEYLAMLAEDTDFEKPENQSWWKQVKAWFIDLLHKIGFKLHDAYDTITDNELRYILWRSYENLVNPGRFNSVVEEAKDIAKQYELKVGEWDETWTVAAEAEPNATIEFNGRRVPIWATNGRTGNRADRAERNDSTERDKDYEKLKKKYPAHMIVKREGDFYLIEGEDAKKAANLLGYEMSKVNGIDAVAFPAYLIDEYLPKLVGAGVKVAIADNVVADGVAEDGVRFRDGDFSERDEVTARDYYERMVSSSGYQFREAVQDSMLGLRKAYEAILGGGKKFRIEEVPGNENAYLAENRMSSVNAAEQHNYFVECMKPLLEEIHKICGSDKALRQELTDYMMAKHGLERNRVFAERDAQNGQNALNGQGARAPQNGQGARIPERDYAGLTALTGMADVHDAELAAMQMVADFEAQHDVSKLWAATKQATGVTLAKIYLSGMLSKESYEQIRDQFEWYIPLQGFDETTSDEVYGYLTSRKGPFGSPIKHAEGRSSKADDPIATIGMMADMAIRQANRNEMKKLFLNFVLDHPSDLVSVNRLWLQHDDVSGDWMPVFADIEEGDTAADVERKVAAFEQRMEQLAAAEPDKYKHGRNAKNIPYRVLPGNLSEHQVLVKRDGETYVLTINGNPRAAQALNGLTNPDVKVGGVVGDMMKVAEWVNHNLSAAYTTRTPDFVVSNYFRDMLYSNCMTWVKEGGNYALRFHKNFGKFNPATMRVLFGKWEKGTLDESKPIEFMFKQFMLNGGETGYTNVRDIEAHKREIARELKRQGNVPRKAWHAFGMQLDLVNRSVENCARFAAFITSQEMGRSVERSIYDAKEVSVNFNKKGSGGKMVNATGQTGWGKFGSYLSGTGRLLFVFWNAGTQGMTNFMRAAKHHPGKFSAGAATMFALGAIIPLLAKAIGDDDDDENAYYNLPEYVRRSNICFRFTKEMPWITIPLPIEFRAIYGLGELGTGVITGDEHYNNWELARQLTSQVSQILPLDFMEGGGGLHAFIPSLAKPIVEASSNKGWTGLPIYRDNPFNQKDPEFTKVYKNADKNLVAASKWLNELTGGDDYKKGWADKVNPAQVEYVLNGYLGGWFKVPNQLMKMGETAFGDRDFEWRNMMLANRLIKNGDERTANRKLQNEYFELKDEYEETKRLLKKYKNAADEGVLKYAEKLAFLNESEEYGRYLIFDDYRKEIDKLYKQMKEEEGEQRKATEEEYYSVVREMVDKVHEYNKKQ